MPPANETGKPLGRHQEGWRIGFDLGASDRKVSAVIDAMGSSEAVGYVDTHGHILGYALPHYADFYDIRHVLILGRCTSGQGGALILEGARAVLQAEFPVLAASLNVQLPDERSRRVGQSIAAASLPKI